MVVVGGSVVVVVVGGSVVVVVVGGSVVVVVVGGTVVVVVVVGGGLGFVVVVVGGLVVVVVGGGLVVVVVVGNGSGSGNSWMGVPEVVVVVEEEDDEEEESPEVLVEMTAGCVVTFPGFVVDEVVVFLEEVVLAVVFAVVFAPKITIFGPVVVVPAGTALAVVGVLVPGLAAFVVAGCVATVVVVGAGGGEGRVVIVVQRPTPIEGDNQPGGDDHGRHRQDLPPVPLVTSRLIRHMVVSLPRCPASTFRPFPAMTSCPDGTLCHAPGNSTRLPKGAD